MAQASEASDPPGGSSTVDLPRPEPDAPLQFGKYRLLRLLARGGMGEVYLARLQGELGFEKDLVIKTILPELAAKPRFIELFAAEAKTAVALSHGNIVPTYELGRWGDTFYIAMGYVEGPSVSQVLRAFRRKKFEPNIPAALHIIRGVLTGLAYAHRDEGSRHAVVHRDISPRNVLVDRSGQVRIVDFGIAARAREQVELRAGSQGYMAPEQARAEAADPRADVFSAACLLYELLTLEKAFPKDGVWAKPDISGIPELLCDPLAAALDLEPDVRPKDAAEFLQKLRPALAEHAAAFADHDLANLLAELFPDGWGASEPAWAGKTNIHQVEAETKTFATRLTAVTKVHKAEVDASGTGSSGSAVTAPEGSASRSLQASVAGMSTTAMSGASMSHAGQPPRRRIASTLAWVAAGGALVFVLTRLGKDDPPPRQATPQTQAANPAPTPVVPNPTPPTADAKTTSALEPSDAKVDDPSGAPDPTPPPPTTHRLAVEPEDAEVWVDDKRLPGSSPYTITLPETGEAKLTIKKEGFVTRNLGLSQDGDLPAKLELRAEAPRGDGFLRVSAPGVPWARVLVDGKRVGFDTPTPNITLPAGRHRVEVKCIPDACPNEQVLLKKTITIKVDETTTLTAN